MTNFSWTWSEKRHKAWASTRAKGLGRFVIVNGLIAWGAPMFLIMGVAPAVLGFPYRAHVTPHYWVWPPLLWFVASLIYAFGTWSFAERSFRKHEARCVTSV